MNDSLKSIAVVSHLRGNTRYEAIVRFTYILIYTQYIYSIHSRGKFEIKFSAVFGDNESFRRM